MLEERLLDPVLGAAGSERRRVLLLVFGQSLPSQAMAR